MNIHLAFFLGKFHHFYNPGLGAVLCIHVPCGIYYIFYIVNNGLSNGSNWLFGIIYLFGMIILTILFGQVVFSSKDSPYPFDESEVAAGERLARKMGL